MATMVGRVPARRYECAALLAAHCTFSAPACAPSAALLTPVWLPLRCSLQADSGDEADAVLSKFGLGPQPAEEEFKGDFNWAGFKQVHTITEQNQELMRQLGEKDAEIER